MSSDHHHHDHGHPEMSELFDTQVRAADCTPYGTPIVLEARDFGA